MGGRGTWGPVCKLQGAAWGGGPGWAVSALSPLAWLPVGESRGLLACRGGHSLGFGLVKWPLQQSV